MTAVLLGIVLIITVGKVPNTFRRRGGFQQQYSIYQFQDGWGCRLRYYLPREAHIT